MPAKPPPLASVQNVLCSAVTAAIHKHVMHALTMGAGAELGQLQSSQKLRQKCQEVLQNRVEAGEASDS